MIQRALGTNWRVADVVAVGFANTFILKIESQFSSPCHHFTADTIFTVVHDSFVIYFT